MLLAGFVFSLLFLILLRILALITNHGECQSVLDGEDAKKRTYFYKGMRLCLFFHLLSLTSQPKLKPSLAFELRVVPRNGESAAQDSETT